MEDYYDCFDPDTRTYLWLDSSEHGRNGAPHHMKDVLEDMKAVKKMIGYLYLSL